jgi:hypothetical protein
MTLKMDLVGEVPESRGRHLSPEMVAILERANLLGDKEILKVEGLIPPGEQQTRNGRAQTLRNRGFHVASRLVDGVVTVYVWRKDSPAG